MNILKSILTHPLEVTNDVILTLLSCIDLTTLHANDTVESVTELIALGNAGVQNVYPAAFCVFSNFADLVAQNKDPRIKTAVVAGGFPIGQQLSAAKIAEIKEICQTNVDEIDVVMNRGSLMEGDFNQIVREIKGMKDVMNNRQLKVILETGELQAVDDIKKASELAIEGGADFIKTSTGKTEIGATPQALYVMCLVIKEHAENTGIKIGIKPSGGIRTLAQALDYYKIISAVLGKEWLNPTLFRIGASSLYNDLKKRVEWI